MLQELTTKRPAVRANGSLNRISKLSAHYDALLQQIQTAGLDSTTGHTIGITSCAPRAGVSTVAFNIAVTAAHAGYGPVLFVDADINQLPGPNAVGVVPATGLADVLSGAAESLDCVNQTPYEKLSILSGRGIHSHSVAMIDPNKFSEILDEYKRHFKLIVIDVPAPTEVNGSLCLAGQFDGVLLVIEAERADGRAALRTKHQLVDAGAKLLGVVLNKRRQHVPGWLYRLL